MASRMAACVSFAASALLLAGSCFAADQEARVTLVGTDVSVVPPADWHRVTGSTSSADGVDIPSLMFVVGADHGDGSSEMRAQAAFEKLLGERRPASLQALYDESLKTRDGASVKRVKIAGFDALETAGMGTMYVDVEPVDGVRPSMQRDAFSASIIVHARADYFSCSLNAMPGQSAGRLQRQLEEFCSSVQLSKSKAG